MAAATPQAAAGYRSDIDGVRAIAVLLVLVFHFELLVAGKAGFIGVDVFFVISGFLITGIIRRQLDEGSFRLGQFYTHRVRRLAPALLVTLALTLAVGALDLLPADFLELVRQALASQFYVANIYYWKNVNYFGLGADNIFLLHMWSLAVEEQFYLLYPLLLIAVHRWLRRWFWTVLAAVLLVSFALNLAFVASRPEATFYLLPTRAWELLAGAFTLLLTERWRPHRRIDEALGWGGAALIVAAIVAYDEQTRFPGWFALLPVLGGMGLLLAGRNEATLASRLLSLPVMSYVGKISYPLYLVHWPINVFASRWYGEQYGWGLRFAMFALAVAAAAAIYHAIEQPVRQRRVLARERGVLVGYGVAFALTLLGFGLVWRTGGLPQRFPAEVARLAAFAEDRSPPLADCEFSNRRGPVEPCRIGAPGPAPRWLVYGDSHAWAAHGAFDRWLASRGEAGLFMFRNSCPPIRGVHVFKDQSQCHDFNEAMAGLLERRPEVDSVVLVSAWLQAAEGRLVPTADTAPSLPASLSLFDARFAATVQALHAGGRRVYVWEPVPGALQSVPQALARAALGREVPDLVITPERYRADHAVFLAALEKNRASLAGSFSPSALLCGTGRCAVQVDGRPIYFDGSHVTRSSADLWVDMMRRTVPDPR
ncbi:acyltransferase family protein [uncultured Methylibium sp.]|uniref:acyltransferase family protein n=1 Tax=uncultured Methylibium sp. TaxID=381093 RepID=UPI0025EBB079|nr:acyltransferase family protein [uncultured Methylibium sp.]